MFPRLRIKTKLILAISSMVMTVVALLSSIYITQLVHHRMEYFYQDGDFSAHQVFHAVKDALEEGPNPLPDGDQRSYQSQLAQRLQSNPGLNSLMESIVGYSSTIYDVAIAAPNGTALVHSDPYSVHQALPEREDFQSVRKGSVWRQLAVVYGKAQVYEIRLPIERRRAVVGTIRIGISTIFLKSDLQPLLNRALGFAVIAMLASLVLAAAVSNYALRPLEIISRRLDVQLNLVGSKVVVRHARNQESPAAIEPPPSDVPDEVGMVTTKIDRLGQEVRDVQEVFSLLKENLDQVMANLQDGLMLFTKDERAVLVSASVERFLGKTRVEILGLRVPEIFVQTSTLNSVVLEAFARHSPLVQREVENGTGKKTQLTLDFIEELGERIGALLTLHDSESMRKIEDEIELSRRLSAIGRLTSGVAHEVKNPINAIVVHLEVLREKYPVEDPEIRRHMDVIGTEIRHLDRVIQNLVDFTRPVELRLQETDLREIISAVVELSAPDAQRHSVKLISDTSPTPLPVKVDVDLVQQGLLNVVLNGVQAMPEGGTLTISAARSDSSVLVTIRDQGPGIPPEIRDKIFNLYFTTKRNGSGIGLPMTYRVMQLHNGSIKYESSPAGTAFLLRLPLAKEETRVSPHKAMASAGKT